MLEHTLFLLSDEIIDIINFAGVLIASLCSILAIYITNKKQKEMDEFHRRISPSVGIYLNRTYKFPLDAVKKNGGSVVLRTINFNDLLQQSSIAVYVANYSEFRLIDPHFTITILYSASSEVSGVENEVEKFAISVINQESIIIPVIFKNGMCSFNLAIEYKTEAGEKLKYLMIYDHNTNKKTGKLYLWRRRKYVLIDEIISTESLVKNESFVERIERRKEETSVTRGDTGVAGKTGGPTSSATTNKRITFGKEKK